MNLNEIKDSATNALKERISSPFYGTLIISWILWNWQIIYLTIFISSDDIKSNKIDYIINYYSDPYRNILYPITSALFFVIIMPRILYYINKFYWEGIDKIKKLELGFSYSKIQTKDELAYSEFMLEMDLFNQRKNTITLILTDFKIQLTPPQLQSLFQTVRYPNYLFHHLQFLLKNRVSTSLTANQLMLPAQFDIVYLSDKRIDADYLNILIKVGVINIESGFYAVNASGQRWLNDIQINQEYSELKHSRIKSYLISR